MKLKIMLTTFDIEVNSWQADLVPYDFWGTRSSDWSQKLRIKDQKVNFYECPYCGSRETEVVETRDSEDLETIRRRRNVSGARKDLRLTKDWKYQLDRH